MAHRFVKPRQGGIFSPSIPAQEIANSVTHGVGAALSIAALIILVVSASLKGDIWQIVSFSIYGTSLILLYLASTLYHIFYDSPFKSVFKVCDHSAIYLLIAGTYTPFLLVNMRGPWAWLFFWVIWSLAIGGVVFKVFFVHRFRKMSTIIYIVMGWLCVLMLEKMLATIPPNGVRLLFVGGIAYTAGVIFYVWHRLPYNHAIWHLFVLAGSVSHFFAVFYYVLPFKS